MHLHCPGLYSIGVGRRLLSKCLVKSQYLGMVGDDWDEHKPVGSVIMAWLARLESCGLQIEAS